MTGIKQSQFGAVTSVEETDNVPLFTAHENKRISYADMRDQMFDEITEGFIHLKSVQDLRLLSKSSTSARTAGYYTAGDGGAASYWLDVADTSSPDDGGSVIVSADGGRWKLQPVNGEVNTKQFGQNLQKALDYIGLGNGVDLCCIGEIQISSACYYRPQRALAAVGSGSAIHYADHVQSVIRGAGNCIIKPSVAVLSMDHMLCLQYNASLSAIAPFYTTVKDIAFDLGGVASVGILSDYCMHNTFCKVRAYNGTATAAGIKYIGYGVANIEECMFSTNIGVDLLLGGGDSRIVHNDFFPTANGKCVRIAKLAGNCSIHTNIFNGEGNTGCIGVDVDGTTDTDIIRDVRIFDNEFSGMNIPIRGRKHASARNVYSISVGKNHVTPAAGGAVWTGNLVDFTGVDDATVSENRVNTGLGQTLTDTQAVKMNDCRRPAVYKNKYYNLLGGALYLTAVTDGRFDDEEIIDCGRQSAGHVLIDVDSGCTGNTFSDIKINQSSASFAQNTIYERAGANNNKIERPNIVGASRPNIVGATSNYSRKTVASGAFSSSGASVTTFSGTNGLTFTGNSTGNVTVNLATTRKDDRYGISVTSDKSYVVDSRTSSSFRVLLYDVGTNTSNNTAYTSIEVNDL